jgi:hypothetical protein
VQDQRAGVLVVEPAQAAADVTARLAALSLDLPADGVVAAGQLERLGGGGIVAGF